MEIAVVILNWNGRQLLEEFLPTVVRFSKEATVYIADNASTDDSISYVQANYPSVNIIRNAENGGFAKGYNQALRSLKEEVFILLNSDVEVTENWLLPIKKHLNANPTTAIVQPKLLDYKNKAYFEYAGAAGGYLDRLGYPFCRGRIFDTLEKDEGQYDQEVPVLWASGACLAIRGEVYRELGGLDEMYFAHQEEIDLCWRAHRAGYQVYYVPDATVYHLGGATLAAMNPQKTYLNFRNSLFNLLKNVPGRKVYLLIFLRLLLDGVTGVKFFFEGKFKHTWAIIRAHFGFYKRSRKVYRKRKVKNSFSTYYTLNSIVWGYYVLKRKKYKNLNVKKDLF